MNDTQSIINLDSLLNLSAQLNGSLDCNTIMKSAMLSLMGKLKIPLSKSFLLKNNEFIEVPSGERIAQNPLTDLSQYFDSNSLCDIKEINIEKFENISIGKNFFYLLTLSNSEQNLAIILLGEKIDKASLSDEEKYYAKIVAQITSIALSNALNFHNISEQLREIERRNLLFQNLLNISNDFLSFGTEDNIIKTYALHLMGQLQINNYALFLKNNTHFIQIQNKFNFSFPNNLNIEIENATFEEISLKIKNQYTEVKVAVPLYFQSELKGILLLGNKMSGAGLTQEDLLFTEMLSNTFIIALENYRLLQEEIKKQEIERDLALAKEIQERLLPKILPKKDNWDFYGLMKPSQMVGGDYFDFIELNNDEVLIIVADVSGKGIGASLLMANLQASLHSFALLNLHIDEIVKSINRLLYQNTAEDKFVTFFIGKLNYNTSNFSYINAGHNPPVYISKQEVNELNKGCLPLGIEQELKDIEIGNIIFKSGDIVAIFTDGIVEATNSEGIEFGKEKLIDNLIRYIDSSAKDISDNILNKLINFTKNKNIKQEEMIFQDDITLNIIKRK